MFRPLSDDHDGDHPSDTALATASEEVKDAEALAVSTRAIVADAQAAFRHAREAVQTHARMEVVGQVCKASCANADRDSKLSVSEGEAWRLDPVGISLTSGEPGSLCRKQRPGQGSWMADDEETCRCRSVAPLMPAFVSEGTGGNGVYVRWGMVVSS